MKRLMIYSIVLIILALCTVIIINFDQIQINTIEKEKKLKTLKERHPLFTRENYSKYKGDNEFLINVIAPMKFHYAITGKYKDETNHNESIIMIETNKYFIELRPRTGFYDKDDGMYEYVQKGDSIFKNEYSLIFSVKRGTKIKNFKVSPLENYWVNPYFNEQ